jgi:GTP-binding protein YchF
VKVPLLGFPLSGKTTLFRALAGAHLSTTGETHLAAVPVPDPRLDLLAQRERPKKTTYATLVLVDVGAMRAGEEAAARLDKLHGLVGDADALLLVVQAFGELNYRGQPLDPARELEDLLAELVLTDLAIAEGRRERLARQHRAKPRGEPDPEYDLVEKLCVHLENQGLARALAYNEVEARLVRGYGLLTLRPLLVVFNTDEGDLTGQRCLPALQLAQRHGLAAEVMCAKLELEIAQLPEEERQAFLAEYGLSADARARIIKAAYALLDVVTFYTINENEARAWTIPRGTSARAAAGKIHSDMEQGFVRAEVLSFADYQAAGSLAEARRTSKIRLEGHDYVVQDGDLLQIRFTR